MGGSLCGGSDRFTVPPPGSRSHLTLPLRFGSYPLRWTRRLPQRWGDNPEGRRDTARMGAAQAAPLVPLVGRGAEQGRRAGLLEGVAQGTPGVLLIGGEAGVGKTALVRDACARFSGQVL